MNFLNNLVHTCTLTLDVIMSFPSVSGTVTGTKETLATNKCCWISPQNADVKQLACSTYTGRAFMDFEPCSNRVFVCFVALAAFALSYRAENTKRNLR